MFSLSLQLNIIVILLIKCILFVFDKFLYFENM